MNINLLSKCGCKYCCNNTGKILNNNNNHNDDDKYKNNLRDEFTPYLKHGRL